MTVYIGLLRAVNVGGHQNLPMAKWREVIVESGFTNPRTLLASGNAVFEGPSAPTARVERRLLGAMMDRLGTEYELFVRTAAEWSEMVQGNPYTDEATRAPSRLLLLVVRDVVPSESWARWSSTLPGPEYAEGRDRHAFVVYPEGIGRSKLSTAGIERALGTRLTARNWNTVTGLERLATAT